MKRGGGRGAIRGGPLQRLVLGHFLVAAAEWAVYIGAFVYAFQQGGTAATGVASICLLAVTVVSSPIAGHAAARWQPNIVRLGSFLGQSAGFLLAGVAAILGGPLWIVLFGAAVSLAAFRVLRPAQAVLMPLLCERPAQLSTANLWIGHSDSSAAFFGPLASTGLIAIGGPGAVFVGFGIALIGAAGLQAVDHARGRSARMAVARPASLRSTVVAPFRQLRSRGGLLSLVGLIALQYGLVGALDILFVVITLDTLGLEATSSSLLTTAFGAGAVGAVALSSFAHRTNRLAAMLSAGLVICAVVIGLLAVALSGSSASIAPLFVGLPILGAARFTVVVVSRALLQRSADDDTVAGVFVLQELGSGVGILAGSITAQLTLAVSGPTLTLAVFAAMYGLVAFATWRSLRMAESSASVPLVEIGLLRQVPAFAPLPPMTLEAVARHAELVEVGSTSEVVRQGETGDRFYVVMTGACAVLMDGNFVRTVERGNSFGEVALLADVPRTATVVATQETTLLAITQEPFLRAVSADNSARVTMWRGVSEMDFGDQIVEIPSLDGPESNTRS